MSAERVLWLEAVVVAFVAGYFAHRKWAKMSFAEAGYHLKTALEGAITMSDLPLSLEVGFEGFFFTLLLEDRHVLELVLTRHPKTGVKVVTMISYKKGGEFSGLAVYGLHEYGISNMLKQVKLILKNLQQRPSE